MMRCRTRYIEGFTTLPNEQVDDDMDIVTFGGESVGRTIGLWFENEGFDVEDLYEEEEHHGWRLVLRRDVWQDEVFVSRGEEDIIISTEDGSPFFKRLFSGRGRHRAFQEMLWRFLSSDPRFHSLKWTYA